MGQKEFVAGLAMLMSLVAMAIDAMLPALSEISREFNLADLNQPQWIISFLFLGLSFGQMFFGPFSDSYGRKTSIYLGISVFMAGSIVCAFSQSFEILLFGRLLQGFGASTARVVSMAIVRDQYEGRVMAKIVSLITMIFILVPALAPSIGQFILHVAEWRTIFKVLFWMAFLSVLWFSLRVPETLPKTRRAPFSLPVIYSGIKETLTNPTSLTYTFATGLVFSGVVGYLTSAQQILQIQYDLGDQFPIYFGILTIPIGIASFLNSKFVTQWGMESLCLNSLKILATVSMLFLLYSIYKNGHPELGVLLLFFSIAFFCLGGLFGNFNALAMSPLGHIAGIGNSVISSVQSFSAVLIGGTIGQLYNQTVIPVAVGFTILSIITLILVKRIQSKKSV